MATKDTMTTIENLPSQPDNRHPDGLPGVLRDNAERWRREKQEAAEEDALDARLKKDRRVAKVGAVFGVAGTITGMAISRGAARASESEALAEQRAAHTLELPPEERQSGLSFSLDNPETPRQQEIYFDSPGLPEYQISAKTGRYLDSITPDEYGVRRLPVVLRPDGTSLVEGFSPDLQTDFGVTMQNLINAAASEKINDQPYADLAVAHRPNPDGTYTAAPYMITNYPVELTGGGQTETLNPKSLIWLDYSSGQSRLLYLNAPTNEGANAGVFIMTEQFRQDLVDLGATPDNLGPVGSFFPFAYYQENDATWLLSIPAFINGIPTALTTPLYGRLTGEANSSDLSFDVRTPEPYAYDKLVSSEIIPNQGMIDLENYNGDPYPDNPYPVNIDSEIYITGDYLQPNSTITIDGKTYPLETLNIMYGSVLTETRNGDIAQVIQGAYAGILGIRHVSGTFTDSSGRPIEGYSFEDIPLVDILLLVQHPNGATQKVVVSIPQAGILLNYLTGNSQWVEADAASVIAVATPGESVAIDNDAFPDTTSLNRYVDEVIVPATQKLNHALWVRQAISLFKESSDYARHAGDAIRSQSTETVYAGVARNISLARIDR